MIKAQLRRPFSARMGLIVAGSPGHPSWPVTAPSVPERLRCAGTGPAAGADFSLQCTLAALSPAGSSGVSWPLRDSAKALVKQGVLDVVSGRRPHPG